MSSVRLISDRLSSSRPHFACRADATDLAHSGSDEQTSPICGKPHSARTVPIAIRRIVELSRTARVGFHIRHEQFALFPVSKRFASSGLGMPTQGTFGTRVISIPRIHYAIGSFSSCINMDIIERDISRFAFWSNRRTNAAVLVYAFS